jgi:signal transduction histidine kinase
MSTKRRLRNYLLMPEIQIKFGIYSMVLTLVFAVIAIVIVYSGLKDLLDFVIALTDLQDEVIQQLGAQLVQISYSVIFLIIVYAALNILTAVALSHRMVGPVMAFTRHVKCLKRGEYSSRIHLRKNDDFRDLERELNELAETLSAQKDNS